MLRRCVGASSWTVVSKPALGYIQSASMAMSSLDAPGGRHDGKIKRASKMKLVKPTPKSIFSPRKPKKAPKRLDLEEHIRARRPDQFVSYEDDSDLGNPEIMRQVDEIEREHYRIHGNAPPDYDLERIGGGERTINEELAELEENIDLTEPAFNIQRFSEQLSVRALGGLVGCTTHQ